MAAADSSNRIKEIRRHLKRERRPRGQRYGKQAALRLDRAKALSGSMEPCSKDLTGAHMSCASTEETLWISRQQCPGGKVVMPDA
mmetsp:Transcript_11445/g.15120  ORF Transcript_11445/g.15120 Transcript_11445/m.15120 type:complete len:85 (+) Transcript_11445:311-565(+)